MHYQGHTREATQSPDSTMLPGNTISESYSLIIYSDNNRRKKVY